jgi:hypothetical protein
MRMRQTPGEIPLSNVRLGLGVTRQNQLNDGFLHTLQDSKK